MAGKFYVMMIDPENEAKIRVRILQKLSRKVKGVLIEYRPGEFHKLVGCSIRACYFKYLLDTMQEEELIMKHRRPHTDKLPGGECWALWDHPGNVRQRAWWEKCDREDKENEIAWANSPAGKEEKARKEAEIARTAHERFTLSVNWRILLPISWRIVWQSWRIIWHSLKAPRNDYVGCE